MNDSTIPSFDLSRNWERVREETMEAVRKVLDSQHFILGPEVEALEQDISSTSKYRIAQAVLQGPIRFCLP